MNILIYRYNSICEDAVIRGLKELGHTVYEVILEVENKSPSGQEILDAVDYVCWTRRQEHKPHTPSSIIKLDRDGVVSIIRK